MPRPTMRALAIAVALVASLASGCGGEPSSTPDPREAVPSTLAPRPTVKAQPKIELSRHEPEWLLNGYAASSGHQVWQQSMDLARDWMFRPDLVMSHKVAPDELEALADEMTDEAAERWRSDVRRALKPWLVRDRVMARRPKAELALAQLALWNLDLGPRRGWANPMFGPARVSNGRVIGGDGLGVIYTLRTTLRLRGQGLEYEIPYDTTSMLIWTRVDGVWKLSAWSRNAVMGKERLSGPPEAVASSKAADAARRSARPEPTRSGEPSDARPTVIDSAP